MTTTLVGRFLPESLATGEGTGLSKWLAALASAIQGGQDAIDAFVQDLSVSTAAGEGLDRLGESLAVPRVPGMHDRFYRILIPTKAGAKRGTLRAIVAVLSAAMSGASVAAYDQQDEGPYTGLIPPSEIWIDVPGESHGVGCYIALPPNIPGYPVESGFPDPALDLLLDPVAAEQNDHIWGPVDPWAEALVDSVRLAGTVLVFALL